jgi:hypothetical protein
LQKKNKSNGAQNTNGKENLNETKNENENQKKENGEGEKKKKEAGPVPVVLKIPMHCDGCAGKIIRCVRSFEGLSLSDLSKSCAFSYSLCFLILLFLRLGRRFSIGPLSALFVYLNMLEDLSNDLQVFVSFFSALYLPFSLGFFPTDI